MNRPKRIDAKLPQKIKKKKRKLVKYVYGRTRTNKRTSKQASNKQFYAWNGVWKWKKAKKKKTKAKQHLRCEESFLSVENPFCWFLWSSVDPVLGCYICLLPNAPAIKVFLKNNIFIRRTFLEMGGGGWHGKCDWLNWISRVFDFGQSHFKYCGRRRMDKQHTYEYEKYQNTW